MNLKNRLNNQIIYFKKNSVWAGFNRFTLKTAYSKNKSDIYKVLFVNKDFITEGIKKVNNFDFVPHIFFLIPTLKCDLNCDYCFVRNKQNISNNNMSLSIAERSIKLFLNYYAKQSISKGFVLNFYGGEPLINWDVVKKSVLIWIKLIKKINKGSTINIITNGMLLNKEIALFCKKYNVSVSVSLDGRKEVNEYYRKNINFDKVIANFKLLKKIGVNTNISFTLNDKNYMNLKSEIIYIDELLKPNRILVNLPLPVENIKFNIEIQNKIINSYFELFDFMKSKGISDNIFSTLLYRFVEKKIGYYHCPCSKSQIVVDPDGNIGPCHSFIGNINFFPGNIYDNYDLSKISLFNDWIKTSSYSIKQCKNCIGIGLCRGGCRYVAKLTKGNIRNVDERICLNIDKIVEYLVWSTYKNLD